MVQFKKNNGVTSFLYKPIDVYVSGSMLFKIDPKLEWNYLPMFVCLLNENYAFNVHLCKNCVNLSDCNIKTVPTFKMSDVDRHASVF